MKEIIIIGSGPAGVSAALYAARAGRDVTVISQGMGALEKAERIENYYGAPPMTGAELHQTGIDQAKALGVTFEEAQVLGVSGIDTFAVRTDRGEREAISVILATGAKRGAPPVEGLQTFEGRGVSYCAVCDAFFYRGRAVVVLGSGDFALHEAEVLAPMARSVTILTDGKEPAFSHDCAFPVDTRPIAAIEGTETVEAVRFADGGRLLTDGVFVALGVAGSGEMARQIGAELTPQGKVVVDEEMATTIPGLYAAGDCTGGLLQVAKAVYDGARAGMAASLYVRTWLHDHGQT